MAGERGTMDGYQKPVSSLIDLIIFGPMGRCCIKSRRAGAPVVDEPFDDRHIHRSEVAKFEIGPEPQGGG